MLEEEELEHREFKILMDYAKAMHRRYYHAMSAFYAYEALRESIAPNIIGEFKAKENAKIISDFKNFFLTTQEALRIYFFLELAKMFDSSRETLHIDKILNFTESNLKNLTVDAFEEYNKKQNRSFLEDLAKEYKGIDYNNLIELREMLKEHKNTLEKLETYRNKWLAHDEIHKPRIPLITGEEVKKLFDVLEKILNSITGQLNSETWMNSHIENDVKDDVRSVIDYLRRFEPYRLKEIEENRF